MYSNSKLLKTASAKLELRKYLLEHNEIPTKTEMIQNLSYPLAAVIQSNLSRFSKKLLHVNDDQNVKATGKCIKIDKTATKKCNHETILKSGDEILQRISTRNDVILKNALKRKEDVMEQEFCNGLRDALEGQKLLYRKILENLNEEMKNEFELEKTNMLKEFQEKLDYYKSVICNEMMKKLAKNVKGIKHQQENARFINNEKDTYVVLDEAAVWLDFFLHILINF